MIIASTSHRGTAKTYGFRVKFHLLPGCSFRGVHPKRHIQLDGVSGRIYLVKLPQAKRHRFGAKSKYVLIGTRFENYESALDCGRRLKRALALFAADRRIGLDAGQDETTASFSRDITEALATQHCIQLRDDVHGLDVYVEQPPVHRLSVEAYGTSKYVIEGYEAPLRTFYQTQLALTAKQQLALDLYNL